ncbi:hypothetical protein OROHE_018770 [Orobanche hederae]
MGSGNEERRCGSFSRDCLILKAYGDDFPDPIEKLYPRILLMCSDPDVNAEVLIESLKPWRKKSSYRENILVISGEKEVLSYLKILHSSNRNILVALPDGHSADLVPFASCVWHFSSLLDGKPPFVVREDMVPWRAKDNIGKHLIDLTNQGGKKLLGIGFKSSGKSCLKEKRVMSKPSGKQGYPPKQTTQENQQGEGSKVVPSKIRYANTRTPLCRPVNLMVNTRDQSKGRCSESVKKPALEKVSLHGEGVKGSVEFHKSSKEGSNMVSSKIGSAYTRTPGGRIGSPRDQNMGRYSQIARRPALKEVGLLGQGGKRSIEFHKSTKEIGQGSKVVSSKTGNANRRTLGGRPVNPIGGPRVERCSLGVQKPIIEEIRLRSFGKTRVDESKEPSILLST